MGLVALFWSLIIGVAYWGFNLSSESKKSKVIDSNHNAFEFERTRFTQVVCTGDSCVELHNKYILDQEYREQCNKEYIEAIESLNGNINALRDQNVMAKIAPYVNLANKGKLVPGCAYFDSVFGYDCMPNLKECAIIYKWFDARIHSFHPEYYMVRSYDTHHGYFRIGWNATTPKDYVGITPISQIRGDDIYKPNMKSDTTLV